MTSDAREVKAAFWTLYEGGVRLHLDGNSGGCPKLRVRREGEQINLTDDQRELIRQHSTELARMVSEEASAGMWGPAYEAIRVGRRTETLDPAVIKLLEEAQEAYERGDNGFARYRLYQAVRAARTERSVV